MSGKQLSAKELKKPKYLNQTLGFLRERYGIKFKMTGEDSGECRCPFHSEKTPSFKLYVLDDKIMFHCFGGCARNLDLFNIIRERESVGLKEAISIFAEYLMQYAKNKVEATKAQKTSQESAPESEKRKAVADADFEEELEFAAKVYHGILLRQEPDIKPFTKYLAKRGVCVDEILSFGVGVSPPYKSSYNGRALCDTKGFKWFVRDQDRLIVMLNGRIIRFLQKKGVERNFADKFACKIVFPLRGLDGKIKALMGRNIQKRGTWRTHKGAKKGSLLYGIDKTARNIFRHKTVILVEGIYDFFALHRLFKDPDLHSVVVATMGSITKEQVQIIRSLPTLLGVRRFSPPKTEEEQPESIKSPEEEQAEFIKSIEVENYIVAFDNDASGKSFLNRLTELVGPDKNVFRMDMLGLKDPNEVYANVPPFLDLNQILQHMKTAKEATHAKERVFDLRVSGGLKKNGRGFGVAMKLRLHKKAHYVTEAPPSGASDKPKIPKIMHFDCDRLKNLLSYDNDRMPKSRIKDIEALFQDYSAEPFKGSFRLHAAFVKWGYKMAGNALMLLLWLLMEQQRREPHEVSDNATEMAAALNTTSRTIMTHLATLRREGFLIVDENIKTKKHYHTAYLNPDSLNKEKKRIKKGRRRIFPPIIS